VHQNAYNFDVFSKICKRYFDVFYTYFKANIIYELLVNIIFFRTNLHKLTYPKLYLNNKLLF